MSERSFVYRHGKRIEVDVVYPPSRPPRRRRNDTFVMVPLAQAAAITRALDQPKAMVGLVVLYENWANKGKPFTLSNHKLAGYGVGRYSKRHALRKMVAAGLITVEQKRGCAPRVRWVGPVQTLDG
jgi:hypothetical protein